MSKLSSLSLKTKITMTVLLLFLCSIWLLTFFISTLLQQEMTAQIEAQQFSTASYIADSIEKQVKLRFSLLTAVASLITPELIANPVKLREFLHGRTSLLTVFQLGLTVLSKEGKVIADYPVVPGRTGGSLSDREYFRDVVASGKPAVGKPALGRFSRKPIIGFAVPVLARSGQLTGVLAGYTLLSDPTLLGTIESSAYKDFPDRFLVGSRKYHMYITGSDPTRILEPRPAYGVNPLLDRVEAGFEGSGITVNSRGVRILISAKHIPTPGWFIRVGLPTEMAFAPISSMKQWAYSIALGMSLISSFLVWLIIKQALHPLYTASRLIQDITEERLPLQNIPVTRHDEIGQLLTSYNLHLSYRKKVEEEMRLHFELMKNMSEGVSVVRFSDGLIVYANPKFEKMFGYETGEMIGKHVSIVNAPTDKTPDETAREITEIMESTGEWHGEVNNIKKDGTFFWCYAACSMFDHSEYGRVVVSMHTDITERKKAQENLHELAQRLQLATKSAKLGVWDWDITKNQMVWDDRMLELYGHTRETFTEGIHAWESGLHPEDRDKTVEEYQAALRGEKEWDAEFRILNPDGTVKHIKADGLVIRNSEGETVRMLGINCDITERKKAEEQLRNLYLNLQAMREEERAKIAREIHDELGQIMTAIKMDVAWMKRTYSDHKGIFEKTSALLGLIDATIKSIRKICTELRPDILDHLGLMAAIQWQAQEFQNRTGIQCQVDVQDGIKVDSGRSTALFRIFQEALTNVLRHSNATKVIASLKDGNGNVILEVSDNGRGITEEEMLKPDHFGLLGIRERVYPWRGIVSISGRANEGTKIEVILPVK